MEMKEVIMLIMAVVLGVGVLVSVANDLMYTQQSAKPNQQNNLLVSSFNQTIQLDNQNLVQNSVTVINATCPAGCSSSNNDTLRLGFEYQVNWYQGKITFVNRTGRFNLTDQYYPPAYAGTGIVQTIYSGTTALVAIGVLLYIAYLGLVKQE